MAWLKDPLVAFLIAGAGIFLLTEVFTKTDDSYAFEVRDSDINRLTDQWSMQMRRPPTTQELDGLVEQFVKEEIYYRESQRIGLDVDDTIVRRRMVQKLTFLTEDLATATAPDQATLRAYYEDNQNLYSLPDRYSFKHRYFSSDRREHAQADAQRAVADDSITGDPFMLQREYAQRSVREIRDLFGRDFADDIVKLEVGAQWQGPVKSAYGWHAVQVSDRIVAAVQPYEAVEQRILMDWQQTQRQQANEQYYEDLKSRYSVSYPTQTPISPNSSPISSPINDE